MPEGPKAVRLTEDYLDFSANVAHPAGTILIRSTNGTGQYMTEGTKLGQGNCVASFALIKNICEPIEG